MSGEAGRLSADRHREEPGGTGAREAPRAATGFTGTPTVNFATSSSISGNAQTAFGSACDGALFDSTIRLGALQDLGISADFSESFGSTAPVPTVKSTWGKIKQLYH